MQDAFEEGDVAEIEFEQGRVRNVTRGTTLTAKPLPPPLLAIVSLNALLWIGRSGLVSPRRIDVA